MGAQDRTEKVLRDMHVLFSKAQPYEGSTKNVIVDKNAMMELLKDLNSCMYDMMEEYELTVKSRDKANREMQKQGDDIVFEATRKAEDIYAASIMYTDNAFDNLQEALKESQEAFTKIYEDTIKKIKEETQAVKTNQLELKGHLNDLIDTQKYLRLIDEENMRLLREKAEGSEDDFDAPKYAAPEIRINKEYFAQAGIAIDEDQDLGASNISGEENEISSEDLDAEYFKWQEEESKDEDKKPGKKGLGGLFGKKH
ncbi:hypothetical protein SAMN05421493_1037 [Pseudobutyrivibrio sp. 49]|uniref:hypothetical protein n=1 Tax=unclassified Pseudobutyrivibrio TaxID=2638619 RepID=UPI00088EE2AA|nr:MULTISPECIES: hypothetical protein [unclassified Pseudobutyrivibrio]SDH67346.1 hypothetical protein SAMN05421493_1037 [Pseudobutyrivibrio sp. 49]SFN71678.1 hypothetical protein SAMN04487831_1038 [Pseudobutyrivibrio sp. UC1225]